MTKLNRAILPALYSLAAIAYVIIETAGGKIP